MPSAYAFRLIAAGRWRCNARCMNASQLLTERLKREARAQKLGYADLAQRLGVSTTTVKRMFAQRNFDLRRLDALCETLGIDFAALARGIAGEQPLVSQLQWEHEEQIVSDDLLFATAVCTLTLTPFEEIVAIYQIEPAQLVGCLLQLDRMGFLRLLPNNRYRLLVSRTFQWIPDGPILRYFRSQAEDYLSRPFDRSGETVRVVNVRIGEAARIRLLQRVEALVREYSEQHNADADLASAQRLPMSLLVAVRAWEPAFLRRLRRREPTPQPVQFSVDEPTADSAVARNTLLRWPRQPA